jgi:hypothetical protein
VNGRFPEWYGSELERHYGEEYRIVADAAPAGKVFDRWVSANGGIFGNVLSASTTYTLPACNDVVTATYKDIVTSYTITASAGSGGTVSPTTATVQAGSNQTFTASPSSGKEVDVWKVDGSTVQTGGNSYTVSNVTANHSVSVSFKALPPPTYVLTVNGGSGSGSYEAGTVVNISANTAPSGQVFDKWTGNTGGIADVNSASTTYTMGSANATVTATYKTVTPTTYTLTVNGGSGGGTYESGTVVNIVADAAPAGKEFDRWTGNTSGIANVYSASTTYTMGSANATVTATYVVIPVEIYTVSFETNGGSPTPPNQNVTANSLLTKPADPVREGYTFVGWWYHKGWYWDFDNDRVVNEGFSLIADWQVADGIADLSREEDLIFYPNPVRDVLTIRSSTPIDRVRIYTVTGLLVKDELVGAAEGNITVSHLPSGVYFLKIGDKRGKFVKE